MVCDLPVFILTHELFHFTHHNFSTCQEEHQKSLRPNSCAFLATLRILPNYASVKLLLPGVPFCPHITALPFWKATSPICHTTSTWLVGHTSISLFATDLRNLLLPKELHWRSRWCSDGANRLFSLARPPPRPHTPLALTVMVPEPAPGQGVPDCSLLLQGVENHFTFFPFLFFPFSLLPFKRGQNFPHSTNI